MPPNSTPHVIWLSIPALRSKDVGRMPHLSALVAGGQQTPLSCGFPAVTCPVQAGMTTGKTPREHGVVANGFYWRDRHEVEMWTAWNDCIEAAQVWDILHEHDSSIRSAVWFAMHSKGCGADWVCTPAPIHNPDGSESLWCYTKPESLYGELIAPLGHFPLQHFWGPLANIRSSAWIVDSAIHAANRFHPNLFYIYLPHLDYAAQKAGPDSPAAGEALAALDEVLGKLFAGLTHAYGNRDLQWLVASEYAIQPVDHVAYPNRLLREAGLLSVSEADGREELDLKTSRAWTLVDHQLGHVFVSGSDPACVGEVIELFRSAAGIDEVLAGDARGKYELDHPRSGDVVLVSAANSWQAYYWWLDDARAPDYARTIDIHRKPGYDPVELFFDPATRSIPLDASLVQGSHGVPHTADQPPGVLLSSRPGILPTVPPDTGALRDIDLLQIVLNQFGLSPESA